MNKTIAYKNDPNNFVEITVKNEKSGQIITNPSCSFLNKVILRSEAVKYVNSIGMSYKLLEGIVEILKYIRGVKFAFDLDQVNVHPFIYSGYRSKLYFVTEVELEDYILNMNELDFAEQYLKIVNVNIDTVQFIQQSKWRFSFHRWILGYIQGKNIIRTCEEVMLFYFVVRLHYLLRK